MAISVVQYALVREMFAQGWLPQGGAILEVGEANWYGDVHPRELLAEIERLAPPPRRAELTAQLETALALEPRFQIFAVAKVFYAMFFAPAEIQAIDWNGTDKAHRLDLNEHLQLTRRFDVVINHGTAEHVFNIAQVFRTMHEHTLPGGLMMHESPFTDWIDHGFYTLKPQLFLALAEANRYRVRAMFVEDFAGKQAYALPSREAATRMAAAGKMPQNALLFVVFQKDHDAPFQLPRPTGEAARIGAGPLAAGRPPASGA